MHGLIFDIKHCAIHDGPGLRTTIFFKGCPLGCWWCHNPESIIPHPQTIEVKKRIGSKIFIENEIIGHYYTLPELIKEIEKDIVFFDESQGGVTFSGGEPFMQATFLIELAKICKEKAIHTAIDTSGYTSRKNLERSINLIDLYLFDIKMLDDDMHLRYTGVSNSTILKNLEYLISVNKKIIIRYPLIPGLNDSKPQLNKLKEFFSGRISEIHILPYHAIGKNKYKQLGFEYKLNGIGKASETQLNEIMTDFSASGLKVKIGG